MAIPSKKSAGMEKALTEIFGVDRRETIRHDVCISCGGPAIEFKDELSRREYEISSLCSKCQDLVFG